MGFLTSFIGNIKNVLIAVAISLAIGASAGFYLGDKLAEAERVADTEKRIEQIHDVRKDDASSIADAQAKSSAITQSQEEVTTHISTIRKEILTHAPVDRTRKTDGGSIHAAQLGNRQVQRYLPLPADCVDPGNPVVAPPPSPSGGATPVAVHSDDSYLTVGELRLLNRAYERPVADRSSSSSDGGIEEAAAAAGTTEDGGEYGSVTGDGDSVHTASPDDRGDVSRPVDSA